MRRLEEEKRKYEEEQRKNEIQKIYLEEKQRLLDELERIKKSKRFIYDVDTTIYKNAETKTFYSEYMQKLYNNSKNEFPTRNTRTKVFGSDETEENVYINTASSSVNSVNMGCGIMPCPGCGRMVNEQNIAEYHKNKLMQNMNNGPNSFCPGMADVQGSLCPECGRVTIENQ